MADSYSKEREKMVKYQIEWRGIQNKKVIDAMKKVQRHLFVPEKNKDKSYEDAPVSIGFGQTISQPYMVAYMTEILSLKGSEKVLEIGTGSGYQTAILSEIAKEVYSVEIVPELCKFSESNLAKLNYRNVYLKCGDGYFGWEEKSPFDVMIVTAAPKKIPEPLKNQLKIGGRMVVPIGKEEQYLYLFEKTEKGFKETNQFRVIFVPMTGKIQD